MFLLLFLFCEELHRRASHLGDEPSVERRLARESTFVGDGVDGVVRMLGNQLACHFDAVMAYQFLQIVVSGMVGECRFYASLCQIKRLCDGFDVGFCTLKVQVVFLDVVFYQGHDFFVSQEVVHFCMFAPPDLYVGRQL